MYKEVEKRTKKIRSSKALRVFSPIESGNYIRPDCRPERKGNKMNIYVGNLSRDVTDEDLRQAFEAFGEVSSINIIKDRFSGESRGFGFVEMPNKTEAEAAIEAMNEQDLKGRAINVNEAKPKADNRRSGGGGGGGRGGRGGGRGGSRGGGRRDGGRGRSGGGSDRGRSDRGSRY